MPKVTVLVEHQHRLYKHALLHQNSSHVIALAPPNSPFPSTLTSLRVRGRISAVHLKRAIRFEDISLCIRRRIGTVYLQRTIGFEDLPLLRVRRRVCAVNLEFAVRVENVPGCVGRLAGFVDLERSVGFKDCAIDFIPR